MKPHENQSIQESLRSIPIERFTFFLGLALVSLALYPLMSRGLKHFWCIAFLFTIFSENLNAMAPSPNFLYNQGIDAFEAGDYAAKTFSQALVNAPRQLQSRIYFNRGNTFFEEGATLLETQPQAVLEPWKLR